VPLNMETLRRVPSTLVGEEGDDRQVCIPGSLLLWEVDSTHMMNPNQGRHMPVLD
jgi:hypothetical protein